MLIWQYASRRIAMASGRMVPPRRGEVLDRETGEPVQNWTSHQTYTTSRTNAETGEVEQTPINSTNSERRRPFQVPKNALQCNQQKDHNELETIFNDKNAISEYYHPVSIEQKFFNETHNISPVVFLLPTLFLFPFPAWLTVVSILVELGLHMWAHKTNKHCKDSHHKYRSPLHALTSQFCALCKSKRYMQKVGRLQDARTLKVYSRKPKYCTYSYVEKVSVMT